MAENDEGEYMEATMAVTWGWCPGYGRGSGGGMRGWLRTAALGWGLRAQTGVEKCL